VRAATVSPPCTPVCAVPGHAGSLRQHPLAMQVRRDGANWEDFFVNMNLVEAPTGMRWLISSIYKQGVAQ
jgi:hypothetical protein